MEDQIKSRERISDHGEVFTRDEEVVAMTDLVKAQASDIQATFLEPTCGTGNFLTEILKRKLKTAYKISRKNDREYQKNILISISSIYGIEIQLDNVVECRIRLAEQIKKEYKRTMKKDLDYDIIRSLVFILSRNIVHGNALNMKFENSDEPLKFTNWSILKDDFIMEEFIFEDLFTADKHTGYFPKPISNMSCNYKKLGDINV